MQLQQREKHVVKQVFRNEEDDDRRAIPQRQQEQPRVVNYDNQGEHWCYHCASPLKYLSTDMRKTVQQLLKVRRTTYPQDVMTKECNNARNFSTLFKQTCRHPYCETLSVVDHNEGTAFVIRGCAENFGAIDSRTLEQQDSNSCTKLHDLLDIQECICRNQNYCYAGQSRRRSASSNTCSTIFTIIFMSLVALIL
ncbi:hypothetical protein OESDEN_05232 [Oesophagostomum dentatum]|uniref:Uncharacterized protein n=1 Tax=Oesophagostomum dentatum TaxID=61180 RepID=A0A0B1TFF2_OESDE|nr:hypothetical protein OESDEN_05232 [Oesophagostomum dentatum]